MRADDRPVETRPAGTTDQPDPAPTLVSRRGFHRAALGAAGALTIGLGGTRRKAAAAEGDFALPVPTDGRSSLTKDIERTVITVDPALATNPPEPPVTGIGFNPKYTPWEASNRLDVAAANALIRTHAVAAEYLDGVDFTALQLAWYGRDTPVEPDWDGYVARLSLEEELIVPIVALPADAPVDAASVEWLEVDLRQGVVLNYVNAPQLFGHRVGADTPPLLDWSYRVGSGRRLHIDIHPNLSQLGSPTEVRELSSEVFSYIIPHAFQCLIMTLGTFDDDGLTWYDNFVVEKYGEALSSPGLFPDLFELVLGRQPSARNVFPDAILAVEYRS